MKTLKDLEKEIEFEIVDTFKIMDELDDNYGKDWSINNAIEYSYLKAKQDLLKEVKKIIGKEINSLTNSFSINSATGITSSSFAKKMFCKELKSKLGLSEGKQ